MDVGVRVGVGVAVGEGDAPVVIEKLAREKYLMKRDNEDIFVTEDKTKTVPGSEN